MNDIEVTASILDEYGDDISITIGTTWKCAGLDRNTGRGFVLPANRPKLAARLIKAINDQVVFVNPEIKTDIGGNTYVSAHSLVMARYANKDLTELGY